MNITHLLTHPIWHTNNLNNTSQSTDTFIMLQPKFRCYFIALHRVLYFWNAYIILIAMHVTISLERYYIPVVTNDIDSVPRTVIENYVLS